MFTSNKASQSARLPLLTIDQVAERLGVSAKTIRRWVKQGDLPIHRLGRGLRVTETDFERFLAARRGFGTGGASCP